MEQNDSGRIESFDFNVESVTYGANGKLAIAGSNLTSSVWNGAVAVEGEANKFEVIQSDISSSTACWCGNYVITGHDDGSVKAWPTADVEGVPSTTTFREHYDVVSSVSSNSNTEFASASWDFKIKIWDLEGDRRSKVTLNGHYKPVNSIDLSPSSSVLVSTSRDNNLILWDARTNSPTSTVSLSYTPTTAVFSPLDSNSIAVAGQASTLNIYDLRSTQQQAFQLKTGHKDSVHVVRFSKGNKGIIATGGDDGKVLVYDLVGQKQVYSAQHTDFVRGLSWSIGGVLVSGSWDKTVRFHQIQS
eukprot:TRINITY_DN9429_c0_g1_i1.p1 TRINITY_DN9429_c0_g1~~TRINITY_DN9429_c0_g1_i1.p1  ORF type:complete len:302 (-),score=74.99 TRINITY_DN9429_c0_g1_i1:23-928(-)